MNETTAKFFSALEDVNDQALVKVKAMWQMSELAATANLTDMQIDLTALKKFENLEFTPLAYAIWHKNIAAFKFLLSKGLDINLGEPSPLKCAIFKELEVVITQLTELNVEVNKGIPNSPLQSAVAMQMESTVLALLAKGADPNLGSPTPLYTAIDKENINLVNILIQHGADPNLGAATPLWLAVSKNNQTLTKLLIENGAKVDQVSKRQVTLDVKVITSQGWKSNKHYYPEQSHEAKKSAFQAVTPIYQAIDDRNLALIKLLLLNDADLEIKTVNEPFKSGTPSYYETKVISDYEERSAKDILPKTNRYYYSYQPKKGNEEEDKKILAMVQCAEKLKIAKVSFYDQNQTQTLIKICEMYEQDKQFLLDYLANKIHMINLNCYQDTYPHDYILKFLNIFSYVTKDTEIKVDQEAITYLQETLLLELNGHDPEQAGQKIRLFKDYQAKTDYIKNFAQNASWEPTFLTLAATAQTAATSGSNNTTTSQADMINNFGLLTSSKTTTNSSTTSELLVETKITKSV